MNVTIHHSGSSGNLCQVDDILIEAGVPIKQIKKALNYKLSDIVACLCSHGHLDHACAAKDIMKAGIDCYCSKDMANELGLSGHRLNIIEPLKQFKINEWIIKPIPLVHDVKNMGFLILKGTERLLYACDTSYIPYRFKGLTYVTLGVNYDSEILIDNITCGYINLEAGKRILKNHMSLSTAKEFFRANDMSQLKEIYLLHLSDGNSDEKRFKREIEQLTGVPVYIAKESS